MENKKILIVVSNHPPEKWEDEQRKGWDKIIYLPFPNIPPSLDREKVEEMAFTFFVNDILDAIVAEKSRYKYSFCIQGDYLFSYCLYKNIEECLKKKKKCSPLFVFPSTERKVEEKIKEDGSVEKISTFKFVRWR